jgi:hypothetical protein
MESMTDIIWGNGSNIISKNSFQLDVTHRKDGNSEKYQDTVKIIIAGADLPGLSDNEAEWTTNELEKVIVNAFLKCEIDSKTPEGDLIAKVSHSGAAGY